MFLTKVNFIDSWTLLVKKKKIKKKKGKEIYLYQWLWKDSQTDFIIKFCDILYNKLSYTT